MTRMFRLLAISTVIAGLFTFLMVRPAAASCVVASEAGSQFVIISLVAGHTYTDTVLLNGSTLFSFTFTAHSGQSRFVGDWGEGYVEILIDNTCGGGGPANSFNPGDGRLDPRPADRLAVYCNSTAHPPTLDVWGIGKDSLGHRLVKFRLADIFAASSDGVQQNLGGDGIVTAGYYGGDKFGISWIGGPLNGNGMADFRKTVICRFDPNANGSVTARAANTAPGTCSPSVVVQPGDTLFRIATNNGTTVSELVRLNNLADPNRIQVGQVICLPS